MSFRALVFRGGTCTVSSPCSTSAGVEPGKLSSTCPFGRDSCPGGESHFPWIFLLCSDSFLHSGCHVCLCPHSFSAIFFSHGRFRKFDATPSYLALDSLLASVMGRIDAGESRVWSLLTGGKAAGRDRHTQRQIPVTQGQAFHNYNKV